MADRRRVKLGDVASEVTVGYVGTMVSEYAMDGVPFLRSLNVRPFRIDMTDIKFVNRDFNHRLRKSALRPGDVVTVRTGKPGQTAVIPDWLQEANCSDLVITRPGPNLDAHWLSYYLNWIAESQIASHLVGAVQQHFNVRSASSIVLDLPGIAEQRAIAEVLGALDDKIAANDKTAAASARLAAAIFTRASRLSTRTAKLADLVTTQYGLTASAREHDGPRFLRVMDINKRPWIEWSGVPGCDLSSADLAKYRLNPGDIVVARMADPGKSAMFDRGDPETVFASYLVRLAVHDRSLASYVYYFLNSPAYRRYAEMATTGSVQKNMNARVIVDCEIPLPESHDIATFNASITPLRSQLRAVLAENRRLAQTRDELLPLLMSGKVHVQLDDPSNQLADDEGL